MNNDPSEQLAETAAVIANITDDAVYLGYIQAMCWATGVNNPAKLNEPTELWNGTELIDWDRERFLALFADFDSESACMLLKLHDDATWEICCTEGEPYYSYEELENMGFRWVADWLDKG
jgi:hypothetical protein